MPFPFNPANLIGMTSRNNTEVEHSRDNNIFEESRRDIYRRSREFEDIINNMFTQECRSRFELECRLYRYQYDSKDDVISKIASKWKQSGKWSQCMKLK